ncbi:MAG: threonine/serine dehydratase [Candidatus Heimdallarchaeaceae archaeon]|jgi:threonine dehydratase
MNIIQEAKDAERRIEPHIIQTKLEYSDFLSQLGNCKTYLKLENMQVTGSFKIRGSVNKILATIEHKSDAEFVAASSGNHGLAFAYILKKLGLKGTIYLPTTTADAKREPIEQYDLEVYFHGDDCVKTEKHAREIAEKKSMVFVSPYNDLKIIAGQSTIAIELEKQLESIDYILVPIGGGGLISGIAGYLKENKSGVTIIGCQPFNSAVMYESIKEGKILDLPSLPTLSDGTAGGIEENAITFDLCKKYVDDYILVTEYEIEKAIKEILEKHNMLIEGAAALSVAAFIKNKKRFKGKNVVLILSGSRIDTEKITDIFS